MKKGSKADWEAFDRYCGKPLTEADASVRQEHGEEYAWFLAGWKAAKRHSARKRKEGKR